MSPDVRETLEDTLTLADTLQAKVERETFRNAVGLSDHLSYKIIRRPANRDEQREA